MQLPLERVAEDIELAWQDDPPEERAQALAGLERALAAGRVAPADIRVLAGPDGRLTAAVRLVALRPGEHALTEIVWPPGRPPSDGDLATLVAEAMERAQAIGVEVVSTRIGHLLATAGYERALRAAGFREVGRRIEFETPLAELPREDASPLEWRDLAAVGMELAAATLARASAGDPTGDPERDDPERALRAFLAEPGLTGGPETVQIGFLDGRPAAFVMAQPTRPPASGGSLTWAWRPSGAAAAWGRASSSTASHAARAGGERLPRRHGRQRHPHAGLLPQAGMS